MKKPPFGRWQFFNNKERSRQGDLSLSLSLLTLEDEKPDGRKKKKKKLAAFLY